MKTCQELDRVEITEKDIHKALQRPDSFALFHDHEHYDEMFITWSLGDVVKHRESNLLQESNYDALIKHLEKEYPELENDWMITSCNDWLVGWVDHLSFRAVESIERDSEGHFVKSVPTIIFKVLKSWFDRLESYGIADEDDLSEREHNATLENIESAGRRFVKEGAPDTWAGDLFSWFWGNDQSAVESSDFQGGYPDDDQLKEGLEALGFLDEEYMEEE